MRYGIVSDVHANLEALNAVLDHLKRVDAIVCPGDIVGYGADPNACCDLIREKSIATTLGNHDAAAADKMDISWFNPAARKATLWTRKQLTKENLMYLGGLPAVVRLPEFHMAHSSPSNPLNFTYITSPWDACPAFTEMNGCSLCIIGHSHISEYYILEEGRFSPLHIAMPNGGFIELKAGRKYLVNCGSVGQPRDGNPLASFGILDTQANTLEIKRVEYDIKKAQQKILDAGLPPMLAERLASGY